MEIPSSQTYSVDYQMEFVVTKKLFIGSANKAPEAEVLARGFLNPTKNVYEQIVFFNNRRSGYLYLTVTRTPTRESEERNRFIMQIS